MQVVFVTLVWGLGRARLEGPSRCSQRCLSRRNGDRHGDHCASRCTYDVGGGHKTPDVPRIVCHYQTHSVLSELWHSSNWDKGCFPLGVLARMLTRRSVSCSFEFLMCACVAGDGVASGTQQRVVAYRLCLRTLGVGLLGDLGPANHVFGFCSFRTSFSSLPTSASPDRSLYGVFA